MTAALLLSAMLAVQSAPMPAPPAAVPSEVIAEIRVHGNVIVPNDDVIKLAAVAIGQPFTPSTIADVTARLRDSGKFHDVDVRKRFASIDDPRQISLVIIVNEGPVRLDTDASGSVVAVRRRGLRNLLFLPILDAEDGYGFTYGARLALVGAAGPRSRISFPLTWGGTKQAGVELERPLSRGVVSRIQAGASVERRRNPFYMEDDDRQKLWVRAERSHGPLTAGGTVGWQRVSFAGLDDRVRSSGVDLTLDTRLDPVLPRNAVYATASWEHVEFSSGPGANRTSVDARGYLGLIGQSVLAVRAAREDADRVLPPYMKSLLGGWSSLRGFAAGEFAGDSVVSGSAELRVPMTSALKLARVGFSIFVDVGSASNRDQQDQAAVVHRGAGAGVWLAATVLHVGVSVAHGAGGGTRVNFGGGLSF